ncbi:hypothetical protein Q0590_01240 [Rhodocytophaga aerolata]|uniref:Uncharacterized protein n=1 Tax=Rhodocytophaga aerolata TaxID=455078 RepID=A0ABT8R2I0_9BACT|nr:hypothetical protein [Rhodocytophaga aerolata]MDO1444850.1 hypothetical protein [Rhodocytophaga aerolata]
MKKHRKLEVRKRVNDTLSQLKEAQTDLGRQTLRKHLEVLEKEFVTYPTSSKPKKKEKKLVVS